MYLYIFGEIYYMKRRDFIDKGGKALIATTGFSLLGILNSCNEDDDLIISDDDVNNLPNSDCFYGSYYYTGYYIDGDYYSSYYVDGYYLDPQYMEGYYQNGYFIDGYYYCQ